MSKTIRLVNSNMGKVGNVETSADTWRALLQNEEAQDFVHGDVKGVIYETGNSLELDDAKLPEGKISSDDKEYDYAIYFMTKESKSGSDYKFWSFARLRRECSNRNSIISNSPGNYGSASDMVSKLESDDKNDEGSGSNSGCNVSDDFKTEVINRLQAIEDAVTADQQEGLTQEESEIADRFQAQL